MRVEHEYERKGAFAYLAVWDVHRTKIFGRFGQKTGIKPFERLVEQVMSQEPYRSALRVFWIMNIFSLMVNPGACNRNLVAVVTNPA
jgi:hypothetical protein